MNTPNDINNELNDLNSQLPSGSDGMPYSVPEGYFEGLAGSIMAKIRGSEAGIEIEELSPLLAGISRNTPYYLPENYFEASIENLPALTWDEDSLILSFVDKALPYKVPSGYFDQLPEHILEKVMERKNKVVPMFQRKWMRLAVAAMITGIITLSGISYFNRGSDVKISNDPVAVEIEKASTEELNAFIKTSSASIPDDKSTVQNTTEVKQLLKDVSDTELEAFLDQVPTDDEAFDIN
jgi:hypothetical protein